MNNKEQQRQSTQRETQPHNNNTNPTAELITLSLAAILFAVIVIIQMISIAGGRLF
jgi:hypothetical protein